MEGRRGQRRGGFSMPIVTYPCCSSCSVMEPKTPTPVQHRATLSLASCTAGAIFFFFFPFSLMHFDRFHQDVSIHRKAILENIEKY